MNGRTPFEMVESKFHRQLAVATESATTELQHAFEQRTALDLFVQRLWEAVANPQVAAFTHDQSATEIAAGKPEVEAFDIVGEATRAYLKGVSPKFFTQYARVYARAKVA